MMASDAENDLLASDSERPVPPLHSQSTSEPSLDCFIQLLDSKLDQKLAVFKRGLEEREQLHESQLKKLKKQDSV